MNDELDGDMMETIVQKTNFEEFVIVIIKGLI